MGNGSVACLGRSVKPSEGSRRGRSQNGTEMLRWPDLDENELGGPRRGRIPSGGWIYGTSNNREVWRGDPAGCRRRTRATHENDFVLPISLWLLICGVWDHHIRVQ